MALLATHQARADTLPLGAAASYGVLYEGTGGHNLSISNVTINGNVGVGGTGVVQFSGPGTVNGKLDFSAASSGQYHNTNGGNVGPTSVNYNVSTVTSALSDPTTGINDLSADVSGGTNVAFTNAGETINESTGMLETIDGAMLRVFNVTSYSATNSSVLTVNGDGSGDAVVFNFAVGAGNFGQHNANLSGTVVFGGLGLTSPDQLLFNFQSSNQNINLNNNGQVYQGIILAPNDNMSIVHSTLDGRFFGGDSSDMQIVSGDTLNAPAHATPEPSTPALLLLVTGFIGVGKRFSARLFSE